MSIIQGLHSFASELQKESVPFAIIGGIAMFSYGSERTTFDVDFLVDGQYQKKIKEIAKSLSLTLVNESAEFVQYTGSASIDVIFANRPLSQEMIKNSVKLENFQYPVVRPEDLIGLKIQAYKGDKRREFVDKNDILTLMRLRPNLDYTEIKKYADIFGAWNEIEELKKRI
ncbi:MAG: hypothetical protein AABZ31_15170 [Bdellovibrionota bacterium]